MIANTLRKTANYRNPALLKLARDMPCTLKLAGVETHDPETTVSCHSNLAKHGKGKSMKASDAFIAWGCFTCHAELDQGKRLSREERSDIFAHAMRMTRWMLMLHPKMKVDETVDKDKASQDDDYWLACLQNNAIKVIK